MPEASHAPSTSMHTSKNAVGYPTVLSEPNLVSSSSVDGPDDYNPRKSCVSAFEPTGRISVEGSPMMMSPWNQTSPCEKSPWSTAASQASIPKTGLIGSLVREEGHIYSLAAKDNLLYTGSDSKNIRVWRNLQEFSAFKSTSGLVKAIVISDDKIFTGHQDGKIRVWKVNEKCPSLHKRVGTLPTFFDIFKASIRPKNYVEVQRKRSAVWIKHTDAISCLNMDATTGLLYSASWDRTFKVWRTDTSKCVESVRAHDDAVNSVVPGAGGVVYTGSADGTVKVWKRERRNGGKTVKHVLIQTLLTQENAVTALDLNAAGTVVYCGSSDGLVNFWLCENPQHVSHGGLLKGHKLAILCLQAAGNVLVFTGSADKSICVWRRDGPVHTCLSVLTGHTGPVKCLAVEEDPESAGDDGFRKWVVYTGSLDRSVKVWSVTETTPCVHGASTEY